METKNREKILAIAVGICVLIWVVNVLVLKPMAQSWHDRSKRITELTAQLQQNRQLLARGPELLERWNHIQSNSLPPDGNDDAASLLVPSNHAKPTFIERDNLWCIRHAQQHWRMAKLKVKPAFLGRFGGPPRADFGAFLV